MFLGFFIFLIFIYHFFYKSLVFSKLPSFEVIAETDKNYLIKFSTDQYFYLFKINELKNYHLQPGSLIKLRILKSDKYSFDNTFSFSFNNYLFSNNIKEQIKKFKIEHISLPNSLKIWWNNLETSFYKLNLTKTLIFNTHIYRNKFYKTTIFMNIVQLIIISRHHLKIIKKFYFEPFKFFISPLIVNFFFLFLFFVYCYLTNFSIVVTRLLLTEFFIFTFSFIFQQNFFSFQNKSIIALDKNLPKLIWSFVTLIFIFYNPKIIFDISFYFCFLIPLATFLFLRIKIKFKILKKLFVNYLILILCLPPFYFVNKNINILSPFLVLVTEPVIFGFYVFVWPFIFLIHWSFIYFLISKIDYFLEITLMNIFHFFKFIIYF